MAAHMSFWFSPFCIAKPVCRARDCTTLPRRACAVSALSIDPVCPSRVLSGHVLVRFRYRCRRLTILPLSIGAYHRPSRHASTPSRPSLTHWTRGTSVAEAASTGVRIAYALPSHPPFASHTILDTPSDSPYASGSGPPAGSELARLPTSARSIYDSLDAALGQAPHSCVTGSDR